MLTFSSFNILFYALERTYLKGFAKGINELL